MRLHSMLQFLSFDRIRPRHLEIDTDGRIRRFRKSPGTIRYDAGGLVGSRSYHSERTYGEVAAPDLPSPGASRKVAPQSPRLVKTELRKRPNARENAPRPRPSVTLRTKARWEAAHRGLVVVSFMSAKIGLFNAVGPGLPGRERRSRPGLRYRADSP